MMTEDQDMFDGNMAFEDAQLKKLTDQLEAHGIQADVIHAVRSKLRLTGATRYEGEEFVITRNMSQGFDVEFKQRSTPA